MFGLEYSWIVHIVIGVLIAIVFDETQGSDLNWLWGLFLFFVMFMYPIVETSAKHGTGWAILTFLEIILGIYLGIKLFDQHDNL